MCKVDGSNANSVLGVGSVLKIKTTTWREKSRLWNNMKKILKFRARIKEDDKPKMFYQEDQYLVSFLRRVTSQLYFHKDTKEKGVNEMNGGVHESYLAPFELENCLDEYTGLKDQNEKEIYAGDIVKFIVDQGEMKTTEYGKSTISFWDFQWHVGTQEEEYGDKLNEFSGGDLEVIGNTWENPELLK